MSDNFEELRAKWTATAGKPWGDVVPEEVAILTRPIVLQALKSSDNNINLAASNLFTNALNPDKGCPPILGLILDAGVNELLGVKKEDAEKLHVELGTDDLLYLRLIRDDLIAIAQQRVEESDEAKSPVFARQTSNPLVKNISPAKCSVCFETFGDQGLVLLRACQHPFCEECLKGYIAASESQGHTVISCPLNECKKAVSQRELIAVVGAEKFEKLDRRGLERIIGHDNTFHMCATPDCAYLVCWDGGSDGLPWMLCPKCGHERCLKCGIEPYHKGKTCQEAQSQARTKEEERLNQELFKSLNYRLCPQCKTPIEKTYGCNKMLCYCGCKFCSECYETMPTCVHVMKGHGYVHPKTGGFVGQNTPTPELKLPGS
jgi:hypothetical protein